MKDKEVEQQEEKQQNGFGKIIASLIGILALMAAAAVLTGYIIKTKPELVGLSKGTQQAQAEVDALVAQVGKLIALPTDETPTVATVTDASKINSQPFFANAQNNDKVLIYQKAQKAILYRPSENRIIEVGAVNINNQPVSATASPSPSGKAKATATPVETTTATP